MDFCWLHCRLFLVDYTRPLQLIQNAAVRHIANTKYRNPITSVLMLAAAYEITNPAFIPQFGELAYSQAGFTWSF